MSLDQQDRSRLRIAVVLPYFGYGGAEQMVSLLTSTIDTVEFDVRVYCIYGDPQDNPLEARVQNAGIDITYLRKGVGFSIKALMSLCRELAEYRPDIVHSHLGACMYCVPWIVAHQVPLLHTIHSVPEIEARSRLRQRVMRFLYRTGRSIPIAISPINQQLVSSFYGVAVDKVEVVENPVDFESFANAPAHTETVSGKDLAIADKHGSVPDFDFINVARLNEAKNQKLLIRAFERVVEKEPDARLAIVGGGPLRDELKEVIEQRGLSASVRLLGVRDDISALLNRSKVFVLSSDVEGLPVSALEAMSAGLPVVLTDAGGLPDLVDGNGILVNQRSVEGLSRAMFKLLTDPAACEEMGERSRVLAHNYDVSVVAGKYENLYVKYGA